MKEIQQHNKERLQAISSFLKEYRINSGFTQQELSEYSDVHRNSIILIEDIDLPHPPNIMTIFKLADAMELDVNQLFLEIE